MVFAYNAFDGSYERRSRSSGKPTGHGCYIWDLAEHIIETWYRTLSCP